MLKCARDHHVTMQPIALINYSNVRSSTNPKSCQALSYTMPKITAVSILQDLSLLMNFQISLSIDRL